MDTEHTQDLAEEGLQQFRIERGAQVLGTDGMLGTVHQVVMDQQSGTLQSLVVRGEAGMDYELPSALIETATGDEVRLNIGRADLANHPNLAQPYAPENYTPVESGQVMPPSAATDRAQETPVLTNIEEDAVDVMAPASDIAAGDLGAAGGTGAMGGPLDDELAEMDDLDEIDEVEAVIIPGDRPGEADVYLASASDVPATGAMSPAATGGWLPTRGPQGADFQGPGGRSIVGALAATGVLLFTGGAITLYLLMRRKQERASLGARMRQQASAATSNIGSLRDTLRSQGAARWADLGARARDQQRQVQDRMNVWVPAAAASLALLRDRALERGNALNDALQLQARQAANTTSRAVAPGGSAKRAATGLNDRLTDRASNLRDQMSALAGQAQQRMRPGATWQRIRRQARGNAMWQQARQQLRAMPNQASDAWGRLARRATQATQSAATTAAASNAQAARSARKTAQRATANATRQVQQARATAQRGVRRARRRVRWFRNGIIAGVIGGVLYAPRAGHDTRASLARTMGGIPGLGSLFAPTGATNTPTRSAVGAPGAAGPHPQATLPDARDSWSGMGTTTEQSTGGLPLAPDLTPEDMPGPAI